MTEQLQQPPAPVQYTPPAKEELVLEWQAASRPYKQRNRQYYTTIGLIMFLIGLILFFAGQFLAIAVVIALGFLAYVLSSVPPEIVTNQLTTFGIRSDENLYYWEELGRYWFDTRYGQNLMHVELSRFPNQVTLVLPDDVTPEELNELLGEVLQYGKPPQTTFERVSRWLQDKIPLDTEA